MLAPNVLSSLQTSQAVERVKGVFADVLGTHLSVAEVARLSGIEPARCKPILDALVDVGFLTCGHNGRFRQVA
jgi:DNA-binding IclR family transcriptional regulator